MIPTQQEIADAARLVAEYVTVDAHDVWRAGYQHVHRWQPRADTEAGRSDALVLYIAVRNWIAQNQHTSEICTTLFDLECVRDGYEVGIPGEIVRMFQAATMAAASAIGKHLRESE